MNNAVVPTISFLERQVGRRVFSEFLKCRVISIEGISEKTQILFQFFFWLA